MLRLLIVVVAVYGSGSTAWANNALRLPPQAPSIPPQAPPIPDDYISDQDVLPGIDEPIHLRPSEPGWIWNRTGGYWEKTYSIPYSTGSTLPSPSYSMPYSTFPYFSPGMSFGGRSGFT